MRTIFISIILSFVVCNVSNVFCADDDAIKKWLEKQPIKAGEKTTERVLTNITVRNLRDNREEETVFAYSGTTLMHLAAADGRVDVMKWLMAQGEDINSKADHKEMPMYWAAMRGCLETMKWLKEQGADINAENGEGLTPIHNSIVLNHIEAMKWLKEQGANIDELAMPLAAMCGHLEAMKWLKEQGADINVKIEGAGAPLHFAALNGHIEAMKWLKDQGADLNAKCEQDSTPIHSAAMNGHLEAMKWLKDQGLDINAKMSDGKTPLDVANMALERFANHDDDDDDDYERLVRESLTQAIEWLKENGAVTGN